MSDQVPQKISLDVVIANISHEFGRATDAAWLRTRDWDFESLLLEYKRIETEFLAQVGSSDVHAREILRRITEIILQAALEKEQPFATCRQLWDELCALGFSDVERQCSMTWFYADGCLAHRQFDTGLAVVGPLMTELETLRLSPASTEPAKRFYQRELETLGKLHNKLIAARADPHDSVP